MTDPYHVGPVLRTFAALAAVLSGAMALGFGWVAVAPEASVRLGDRLMLAALAGLFALATSAFVLSAVRGRSPAALPVRVPMRSYLVGSGLTVLALGGVAVVSLLKGRYGPWVAYGSVGVLAFVVGLLAPGWRARAAQADASSR